MDSMNEFKANIKVVGIGGAGNNAIDTMIEASIHGVDFMAINTDLQILKGCKAQMKVPIGIKLTRGLGAGADPDLGRRAAEEDREKIRGALEGADMVFITCGMGGGTGTGASPIVAEICSEIEALTVGVVTKPFFFEARTRMKNAERGIEELKNLVDTLIVVPNDKLLHVCGRNIPLREGFKKADEVLMKSVKSISEIITRPALINLDFADLKTVMKDKGIALIGIGESEGENRAVEAAERAVTNPLLEDDVSIDGATDVLLCISGGPSLTLHEAKEAATFVKDKVYEEANVIFGIAVRDELAEKVNVMVVATGLGEAERRRKEETSKYTPFEIKPQPHPATELISAMDINSPGRDIYDIPTFLRKRKR
jgi:cell division protein FtsZ